MKLVTLLASGLSLRDVVGIFMREYRRVY